MKSINNITRLIESAAAQSARQALCVLAASLVSERMQTGQAAPVLLASFGARGRDAFDGLAAQAGAGKEAADALSTALPDFIQSVDFAGLLETPGYRQALKELIATSGPVVPGILENSRDEVAAVLLVQLEELQLSDKSQLAQLESRVSDGVVVILKELRVKYGDLREGQRGLAAGQEAFTHLMRQGVTAILGQVRLGLGDVKEALKDQDRTREQQFGEVFEKIDEIPEKSRKNARIQVALIGLVGVGLMIVGGLVWSLLPENPGKMDASFFNVAVAELIVVDTAGNPVRSEDGVDFANILAQEISQEFISLEMEKIAPYEIWGPEETGSITGDTREEREAAAKALAAEINASIVFYGVLTFDGDRSSFAPEFYVNHESFEEASEITGQYELGKALRVMLPVGSQIQVLENPALAGRANAISQITIGLVYYSADKFEDAITSFQVAAEDERWLDSAGKEVVYLLIGNAYNKRNAVESTTEYIQPAIENYKRALDIDENYGRAKMGLAGALYLDALGDPANVNPDLEKIAGIESLLDEILALPGQPETSYLEPRVNFQRGQIAFALWNAGVAGEDWLTRAEDEFALVATAFETGQIAIRDIASHSYARLGVIAFMRGNPGEADRNLFLAIEHASPYYEAEYNGWLGQLYCADGDAGAAADRYEEGLLVAEANGDAQQVHYFEGLLDALVCTPG